jgi:hypothetical protein
MMVRKSVAGVAGGATATRPASVTVKILLAKTPSKISYGDSLYTDS